MGIVSGDGHASAEISTLEERYELVREIGRGASALVYLARERQSGQLVAIKAIRSEFAQDPEVAARFEREARTAAALDHPNIARIYAVARLAGRALAIVMQYVPGGTLRDALRERGPLSFEETERVLRDVATALVYAHRQGVVHRDVKPGNIFLEEGAGRAVLSDFGIARSLESDHQLTLTGSAIGTPTYMSPEQIDGQPVDGRSDLYSLGLVGWEMLAGVRPWEGDSLYNVIYKQKHQRLPRLDELRPGIPPSLLFAIEGALLKRREDRWPDADEFLKRLAGEVPLIRPEPSEPLPEGPVPRGPSDTPTVVFRRPGAEAGADEPRPGTPAAEVTTRRAPSFAQRAPARAGSRIPLLVWLALPLLFALGVVLARAREGQRARGSRAAPAASPTQAVATKSGVTDARGSPAAGAGPTAPVDSPGVASDSEPFRPDEIAPASGGGSTSTGGTNTISTGVARPVAIGNAGTSGAASPGSASTLPARRTTPASTTSAPGDTQRRCASPAPADQRACLTARLAERDRELNRVYNQLIAQMRRRASGRAEPPDVRRLRTEQRAWLAQRDLECQQQGRGREGALWAPVRAECLGEIAEYRTAELRERLRAQ